MKFENEEVKEIFNDLIKKYNFTHINWGSYGKTTLITYEELILIEEDFKNFDSIFEED